MAIIFISDLHLEEHDPKTADIFLHFLRAQSSNPETHALYILGDFFESWIGDDDDTAFNRTIIHALKNATQNGLPIYFLHGNRDFLLGKKFFRKTGCVLLPDESVVDVDGTKILLMHGDTLCTEDKAYLKFRKKARNKFFQFLFLMKSLPKRKDLAKKYREASQQYVKTAPEHIMDVTQAEVVRVMKKHNVQYLIHGHTHRQAMHEFKIDEKDVKRIVLGAWHKKGNALVVENSRKMFFVEL